jgi:hypothetical protein
MFPKRREKGLLTQELPNETIVYDKSNHKVHCLNAVSTFVWRRCDGRTSEEELAQLLPGELGLPAEEALVRLALEKLGQASLLEGGQKAFTNPISRRQAVKKLSRFGIAAAAALVVTVAAPSVAHAASGLPDGSHCTASNQCSSGCCCVGQGFPGSKNTCRGNAALCGGSLGCLVP